MQQDAIVVKNAYKCYGKGQPPVLDGLNMTVPQGSIYGLLGASGCGKTTLLSCVVGVRKLDQGDIWVLGGKPGEKESGVPGPRVGYMPQEVSLIGEFSVMGALYYFGRINGLDENDIKKRYQFFSDLLQLPPKSRLVKNLSGGQQRRVSLAASMLHNPELLILDEPTVGLDPILRENIWKFLVKLIKDEGTAVVITTHYIDETKHANKIGLLRCGQLLAETTPMGLLTQFNCQTLEEAFLILSQRQEDRRSRGINNVSNDSPDVNIEEHPTHTTPISQSEDRRNIESTKNRENRLADRQYKKKKKENLQSLPSSEKIFKALLIKNIFQFLRHPGGLLFAFVFPFIETIAFFSCVGGDPKGTVMAIVNDEAGDCDSGRYLGQVIFEPTERTCDYIDLSCRFLHGFDESLMIKKYFNTTEEATSAVRLGQASGTMYFFKNFSQSFQIRRDKLEEHVDSDLTASQIHTALDMGDSIVGLFLQKGLFEKFLLVHEEIVSICNISKKYVNLPMSFEQPIYGVLDGGLSDSMAPGLILTGCFFLGTAVAATIIITDRAEGVWDRSLVQGVTTTAILLSHILVQLVIIFMQVTVVLVMAFAVFQLSCRGNFGLVIILCLLNGTAGMCFGFLISVVCPTHWLANFVAQGSILPVIILCGSVWPLEGMPTFLRYISYVLPTTVPSISLKGIIFKGFSLFEFEVYSGFVITIGWILALVIVSLICLRIKK